MASQHQGKEKEDVGAAPGSPEDHDVLPLDALKSLMPRCEDLQDADIPECARDTIDSCVLEATVRLVFESANATARGNRKVISAEDMARAIEGLQEKDTVPDAVRKEMTARVEAGKRAARMRRSQEHTLREERKAREERKQKAKEAAERKAGDQAAAERKDDGEAEAEGMAGEDVEAPATPEDEGSSTTGFHN